MFSHGAFCINDVYVVYLQGKSLVDKWEEEFTSERDVTDEDFWELKHAVYVV